MEGEHFIFKRENVSFSVCIDTLGQMNGNGYCILTTTRLVFINTDHITYFKGFDIPLIYVFAEKLTKPMFG